MQLSRCFLQASRTQRSVVLVSAVATCMCVGSLDQLCSPGCLGSSKALSILSPRHCVLCLQTAVQEHASGSLWICHVSNRVGNYSGFQDSTMQFWPKLLGVAVFTCVVHSSNAWWLDNAEATVDATVLVFGGNGFLGSEAVTALLQHGINNITVLNRGGSYWDADERVFARVSSMKCDRSKKLAEDCPELVRMLEAQTFDFVLDFTAQHDSNLKDTLELLKNKVRTYILLSSDQIYDVCERQPDRLTVESDAQRPHRDDRATELKHHFAHADSKFMIEEALMKQQKEEDGFNYVILRLADVIGPRDTSHRWWIYQLWIRLSNVMTEHPVHIPQFLRSYPISFVYSRDVSNAIAHIVTHYDKLNESVDNEAFNLAWDKPTDLTAMLNEIKTHFKMFDLEVEILDEFDHLNHFYTYPSARAGPMNVTKAVDVLGWTSTDPSTAINETIQFFEDVMKAEQFAQQRDEIIQVVGATLFPQHLLKFYEALEELYEIDLKHFKYPRDEL